MKRLMQKRCLEYGFVLLISFLVSIGGLKAQETEKLSWREVQHRSRQWYAGEEARQIADNVLLYQHDNGGWLKNINMARELSEAEIEELEIEKYQEIGTTIDNGATHTQLRFLARVYKATGEKKYKDAFLRGMDFLLQAQYENGGWPQFYPIRKGYYDHITFNDGAMMGVMNLLRDIAKQKSTYSFVDKKRVQKAQNAIDKGLDIILKTQVKVDGELTIWCAQHDKDDLSPAKARAYELPSLSGKESTEIVEYLMKLDNPSKEVKQSIRSAVKWFEENKVMGLKVKWIDDPDAPEGRDRIVVKDSNGGPLWGRFNEIETGRPIFVGRDGKIKYHLNEIERERRVNYNYIDNYAEDLLYRKYPEWEKTH
ncbi:pectate lyase [Gramella jeungdoensis]|uniref:Pectate lyase n=1 Tax=Gramella jeungdoensis TaxID=708091 RepID=A0ABT0YY83_9FLAO|nr:pectate lyase [Gramella jeungdoensis]MCM8568430.1 pectate lyase [Gramella jeungdoensis]